MSLLVVLAFFVGTGVEILSLGWLSGEISTINTFSFSMFTFLFGIVVGRSWGKEYFEKMQWHLKARKIPDNETLNGGVMAFASFLLITPGLVTDILGFMITLPQTRGIFRSLAAKYAQSRIDAGVSYYFFKG